jgi:hypothetical protein
METLREAQQRADKAQQELAELKQQAMKHSERDPESAPETDVNLEGSGVDALRQDPMMAYLLDSLNDGKDIGHYGRLVFSMIASHFMADEDVIAWLARDPDFGTEQATAMLKQVKGHDYSPPTRERILEWQSEQKFPILPNADDPDCGNVYRTLKFPDDVYEHIQEYQTQKER